MSDEIKTKIKKILTNEFKIDESDLDISDELININYLKYYQMKYNLIKNITESENESEYIELTDENENIYYESLDSVINNYNLSELFDESDLLLLDEYIDEIINKIENELNIYLEFNSLIFNLLKLEYSENLDEIL